MNATEIKTRHGLILQGIVGSSLTSAGYTYRENWQYDPDNERPDFTIPDSDKPRVMIEVHQTDVRNSFQMKVLRSFNAVSEAKCFFGGSIITVNVLFGDPASEVPQSNLKALCGFFDVNIIPRNLSCSVQSIRIERDSLTLAEDEEYDVAEAVAQLKKTRASDIAAIGKVLKQHVDAGTVSAILSPVWTLEKARISALGAAPTAGEATHYKKALLQSLFLSNGHFEELIKHKDVNKVSSDAKKQLLAIELIEQVHSIREKKFGPQYRLEPILSSLVANPDATRLRKYCEDTIDSEPAMKDFFDDIREPARRAKLATIFLGLAKKGKKAIADAILESLETGTTAGISHERCWVADLMPLVVNESHNAFNRRMFQHTHYTQNLGNPFNNIAIRSDRLGSEQVVLREYADVATDVFYEVLSEKHIDLNTVKASDLANQLASFRIDAAVKLQKLNPLYLEVESVCRDLGISCTYGGCPSLLSDLSDPSDPVGKYDLFRLSKGTKEVLINALYVGEGYGSDHKADEWSARRRSLGYRIIGGTITAATRVGYVIVLDGVWAQKSLKKLHAAGWTHICQPHQLKDTLKECFGLT